MLERALIMTGLLLAGAACERAPAAPETTRFEEAPLLTPGSSSGLVRTIWPSAQDPGPPFYARMDAITPVFEVDGWAVIVFYRDPACIPASFNLLSFFDAPAAFGCDLMVEGFALWQGEPLGGAPKLSRAEGTGAVPLWFVPAGSLLTVIEDGELTIGELTAIPGLLAGAATHFREVLQPHPLPAFLGGGGHPDPKLIIGARGTLEDGRRFWYQVVRAKDEIRSIRLRLE